MLSEIRLFRGGKVNRHVKLPDKLPQSQVSKVFEYSFALWTLSLSFYLVRNKYLFLTQRSSKGKRARFFIPSFYFNPNTLFAERTKHATWKTIRIYLNSQQERIQKDIRRYNLTPDISDQQGFRIWWACKFKLNRYVAYQKENPSLNIDIFNVQVFSIRH